MLRNPARCFNHGELDEINPQLPISRVNAGADPRAEVGILPTETCLRNSSSSDLTVGGNLDMQAGAVTAANHLPIPA